MKQVVRSLGHLWSTFMRPTSPPSPVRWHSWDPHTWEHPWLSRENLTRAKAFSRSVLERERVALESCDPTQLHIAFVCNMANSSYTRAKPLRRAGLDVTIYLHPQDDYVMVHPAWEEFDGVLPAAGSSLTELREAGFALPPVDKVVQLSSENHWESVYKESGEHFLAPELAARYPEFLSSIRTLIDLQRMDVLWTTQAPYLAYLSGRPYVATQSGSDMRFETARGDTLGEIMRLSFGAARLFLVSNPWSYAHARRLGFRHLVYLPRMLDENDYAPGAPEFRAEWQTQSGGDFFVLTTSRLDERNKGSSIGFDGFAAFSRDHPGARLVFVGWGKDDPVLAAHLHELGIYDRVIRLPISGKALLRRYLRSADVFIDQFVLGYFGSAGLEAMACGLPVIGRMERAQYAALCETGAPPVLDCTDAAAVAAALKALAMDANFRRAASQSHRQWFLDNHSGRRWREDYTAVLAATALGLPVDLDDSPLGEPLSSQEREYHAEGLRQAPTGQAYGW